MIRQKVNLLALLKENGVSSYRVYRDNLFGQRELQKLRSGGLPSWATLDKICRMTGRQPGDLIEWVEDEEERSSGVELGG